MNSATTNLNHRTACFNALASVGGPSFEQACEPYTDVAVGNVITTSGGDLPCKWVIHAICGHWKPGAEQVCVFYQVHSQRNYYKRLMTNPGCGLELKK